MIRGGYEVLWSNLVYFPIMAGHAFKQGHGRENGRAGGGGLEEEQIIKHPKEPGVSMADRDCFRRPYTGGRQSPVMVIINHLPQEPAPWSPFSGGMASREDDKADEGSHQTRG